MLASRNPKKPAGRKKFKETRHSVYRVRSRNNGKWVCEVKEPITQTRVWLGTHPTAEMAARAHDVAVLGMRGRSACLKFANSVWRLPVPESSNIRDIQKAASEAAEAFRPSVAFRKKKVVVQIEEQEELPEFAFFVDKDELFGTPRFLDNMAEGLIVSPPQTLGYGHFVDDMEFCVDMSLWAF